MSSFHVNYRLNRLHLLQHVKSQHQSIFINLRIHRIEFVLHNFIYGLVVSCWAMKKCVMDKWFILWHSLWLKLLMWLHSNSHSKHIILEMEIYISERKELRCGNFFLDAQIHIIQIHFVVRSTHCEFHLISLQSLNKIR